MEQFLLGIPHLPSVYSHAECSLVPEVAAGIATPFLDFMVLSSRSAAPVLPELPAVQS